MKTTAELLSELHKQGVKLWTDGNRLRYKGPKDVLTLELREVLRARKADILKVLSQAQVSEQLLIQPAPRAGELPLSFAQQRLWFLNQLEGESATYNVPAAWQIEGPLNIDALERTLRGL